MDFSNLFGQRAEVTRYAPGRVNIIGEHTDYTGGLVLPMAIPQTTRAEVLRRRSATVRAASDGMGARVESFEIGEETKQGTWLDYIQGTVVALRKAHHPISGFDVAFSSTVPVGCGLSSSAALEVSLLRALRDAFGLALDDVGIARIGRAAETGFVGAPIGIMDQMASSLADAETALYLDTRSLHYERVPLPHEAQLVVIDSGITHAHATGDYAKRRAECEEATALLGVGSLREVTSVDQLAGLPPKLLRRARHVVSENQRVVDAVRCLRRGDVRRLGMQLDASHASLRDDFEVSTPDVDRLVAIAQSDPEIFGARMTGGGFGGAIVALAQRGRARDAAARIVTAYGPRGRALVPTGMS